MADPRNKPPSSRGTVSRYMNSLVTGGRSRDRMTEFFKTLLLVVPLTILIWIYAERAQTTQDSMNLVVSVASPDPREAATLTRGAKNISVTLSLEGSRSRLDFVKSELVKRMDAGGLNLLVPPQLSPGREHEVQTTSLVAEDRLFSDSGVTIKDATPASISVRIDEIIERDVPVELPRELAVLIKEAKIEPATVKVRGPDAAVRRLLDAPGGLSAVVKLTPADLRTAGYVKFDELPLLPPRDPNVAFAPVKVKVTMQINPSEARITVPSMPINVQKPLPMDGRYQVQVTPLVLNNVQLRGPQEKIDQIRDDRASVRPTAVLVVSTDDIGKEGRRAVRYELPAGVIAEDAPREVDFRVTEITPGG